MEITGARQAWLVELVQGTLVNLALEVEPSARVGPGRPMVLPTVVLWAGLAIGVLKGAMSQAEIWRIVTAEHLWQGNHYPVTDEAVYRRLAQADPTTMERLFRQLTELLVARLDPGRQPALASFASDVVAIDETTLDPVARSLPRLRAVPPGDDALLPGKLAGVFDLRRQLWRTVQFIDAPRQNEKLAARDLMATLAPGSLVLADLGYFGFAWFDDLTDGGHHWISRCRAKTSYRTEHVFSQDDTTLDALVWLGAYRADRAKHLVRLVRFQVGGLTFTYLTNVRDPRVLSMLEIARLYARRWDIEQAVNLIKRELGLHLLWSGKPEVILLQVWAVLVIAQILQALRFVIACRAEVDLFEVSMELMIRYLPEYAAHYEDPIAAFIKHGRAMGFIRPSTKVNPAAPTVPIATYVFPPPSMPTTQVPRYAHRNCGPNRSKK